MLVGMWHKGQAHHFMRKHFSAILEKCLQKGTRRHRQLGSKFTIAPSRNKPNIQQDRYVGILYSKEKEQLEGTA